MIAPEPRPTDRPIAHSSEAGRDAPRAVSWHLGAIGFSYPEWSGTLYAGASAGDEARAHRLAIYASHFNAVEINTTFYAVPSARTVAGWAAATPEAFRFGVKMPRDVTHGPTPPGSRASPEEPPPGHLTRTQTLDAAHRLLEVCGRLEGKLGRVLLQFPPSFAAARSGELAEFIDRLGPAVPLAVEFRHASWWTERTRAMLRACGVCWVAGDEAPHREAEHAPGDADVRAPRAIVPTADALYVRWIGRHGQFADKTREHFNPTPRLRWWAERLGRTLRENPSIRAVHGFFTNDFAGHAPTTVRRMMDLVGLGPPVVPPAGPRGEPTLFGDASP